MFKRRYVLRLQVTTEDGETIYDGLQVRPDDKQGRTNIVFQLDEALRHLYCEHLEVEKRRPDYWRAQAEECTARMHDENMQSYRREYLEGVRETCEARAKELEAADGDRG